MPDRHKHLMDAYRNVLWCASRDRSGIDRQGINQINKELVEHRVAVSSARATSALIIFVGDADPRARSTAAFANEIAKTDSVQHFLRWALTRASSGHFSGASKTVRWIYAAVVAFYLALVAVAESVRHDHVGLGVGAMIVVAVGAILLVRGIWFSLTVTRAPKDLLEKHLEECERHFFEAFDCKPPSNLLLASANYVLAGFLLLTGGGMLALLSWLAIRLM